MGSDLMEWGGVWRRCQYEIVSRSAGKVTVPLIAPVPGSPVEDCSPLQYGRGDYWKEGYGKEKHQREKPDEPERPPHEALIDLDLNDKNAICNFCNTYGLLGLREIPVWKREAPSGAPSKMPIDIEEVKGGLPSELVLRLKAEYSPEDIYSGWYDYPGIEGGHDLYRRCEPLEVFIKAAAQYQEAVNKIFQAKESADEKTIQWILIDLMLTSWKAGGCNPYPVYKNRKWQMGWSVRSLLEACYLRITLDLTEGKGKYRRCNYKKCNRIFLAHNIQYYCSVRCRKNHTSDNIPPKVLKNELREKRKAGLITVEQRKAAYDFIDRTWKNRNRSVPLSLEQLRADTEKFLSNLAIPWKGSQKRSGHQ